MSKIIPNHHPISCPCKDCDQRQLGCHGNCPAYGKFRTEVEEFNRKQHEKNRLTYIEYIGKRR